MVIVSFCFGLEVVRRHWSRRVVHGFAPKGFPVYVVRVRGKSTAHRTGTDLRDDRVDKLTLLIIGASFSVNL